MEAAMAKIMEKTIEETIDAIASNSFFFREGTDCSRLLLGLKVLEESTAAKQDNVNKQKALPQQHDKINEDSEPSLSSCRM